MPSSDVEFASRDEIGDKEKPFITNVFNLHGAFGIGEEEGGDDFAIPGPFDVLDRDSIYASFCNLAEMCGYHGQFVEYCTAAIGADRLQLIRDYFGHQGE
jgi:hypothetical protein